MASVKKINETLAQLMQQLQGLSTRVEGMENASATPSISTESIKKMKDKINRFSKGSEDYDEEDLGILQVKSVLPKRFSTNDIPKFKPTNNPKYHLRAFKSTMELQGVDPSLYPTIFPHSLDQTAQHWFFHLEAKDRVDWECIAHAFLDRYKLNVDSKVTERELEVLQQRDNEGFTEYYTRWREMAARMVDIPKEQKLVRMFIKNLQPKYNQHLKYLGLSSFDVVYNGRINIEDDLMKNKANATNNSNNGKGKKDDDYVGNVYTHRSKNKKEKRKDFTPIGMIYDEAFDRLHSKGLIAPIGHIEDPPLARRSPNWKPHAICKYHQGRGHFTEDCWTLKEDIQELIDNNKLPLPPGAKRGN